MATLNIGGRKVKVDDSFRQMPPDQQAAAVEEIAASLGIGAPEQQSPEFASAMSDASARSQALGGGPVTTRDEAMRGRPDLAGATAATLAGLVEGIPVLGPAIQNTSDALIGAGARLTGGDYTETVEGLRQRREALKQANPAANIAGNLAGGIGAFGGAAKVAGGAAALGLEGSLGARVANSAVSSGGVSAADAMVRDGDPLQAAALGAGVGAAVPLVGALAGGVTRAVGNRVRPTVQAALNPAEEASRQAGVALRRDMTANPASVMNSADEAVARQTGVPLTNVDRGGETMRALARSVANQSPEARQVLQKAADDRFVGQGPRATEFVRRLTGGNADDIGFQQAIRDTARKVNEPRYRAAFEAPEAQAVWSPQIRQLMQSPRFLAAVRQAESRGADSAAISGFRAVKNPFEFRPDGSITLKMNPDGSRALPTLQFWNQVKRNLDGQIEAATRGSKPDRTLVSDLTQIKNMLVSDLDAKIPAYQVARRGAAGFFDAEDALDAGKKFANSARVVPEAKRAFAQFNAFERKAFQTGYASELIDRIMATRDRSNVIDQVFGNQSRREMMQLVFGPQKAKELEAYVRVETLADQLRGALGNSTTARQLMEMGIGGVGGFALSGGDWTGAITGATLARGTRWAGEKVNARVMEHLGKLLTSTDPRDLQKAVQNAALSEEWMKALSAIERQLGVATRSQVPQIAQAG